MFGSKKSTKTTTSESLTNLGTSLTSGGDIQLSAGADILLSGTKATAAGDIGLQAVGGGSSSCRRWIKRPLNTKSRKKVPLKSKTKARSNKPP